MKYPTLFNVIAALFFCACLPTAISAQSAHSLKERGYEAISIKAYYAFYNDLDELTDGGTFENVTAGYRMVEGAYEILIDLGWMQEILYVDFMELTTASGIANGIEYKRSVYSNGQELVMASINIEGKMAFYSDEKKVVP